MLMEVFNLMEPSACRYGVTVRYRDPFILGERIRPLSFSVTRIGAGRVLNCCGFAGHGFQRGVEQNFGSRGFKHIDDRPDWWPELFVFPKPKSIPNSPRLLSAGSPGKAGSSLVKRPSNVPRDSLSVICSPKRFSIKSMFPSLWLRRQAFEDNTVNMHLNRRHIRNRYSSMTSHSALSAA